MLVGDPAWAVSADEGHLVVTAGADEVWLVEDVRPEVVAFVRRYWSAHPPDRDAVPAEARPVIEHLAALGALRPGAALATAAGAGPVGLLTVGPACPSFTDALRSRLWDEIRRSPAGIHPTNPAGVVVDGSAGVDGTTVVVRTGLPLRALGDVARRLGEEGAPHVLCDLAFDHTFSLGPHVVPGDTACLACLAGRVGTRWGDPAPPAQANAVRDAALAAHLVARWLLHRGEPASSLVNATVAFDLDGLATRREPLWRVPGCPVCGPWELDGRVPLPWLVEQTA